MRHLPFLLVIVLLCSCNQPKSDVGSALNPSQVTKDFVSFWSYYNKEVQLYKDFVALDMASIPIHRKTFFALLQSGRYIPMKTAAANTPTYQLYPLQANADPGISSVIRNIGRLQYKNFQMEGKALPHFNFTDLNGNVYNPENTKGKIVVLKCWFIKCGACIAEMPYLNTVVDQYKHRRDVVFISLAFDEADQLKTFLAKTTFHYPVVANQESYLLDDLDIESYPTHIIINKEGKVVRLTESAEAMAYLLEQETLK